MKSKGMNIVKKKLSELKHPEKNARMHPDKQLAELKRSVDKYGQTRNLVIDENGVILVGNGLYIAMLALGYTEAYCCVKDDLSENEKKKLMLADNRIFELGVDDMSVFDSIIAELGDDLDVPGYDDELLQTLIAASEDVDEMMSSYGTVPEERKEEIRQNADLYKNDNPERSTDAPLPVAENTAATAQKEAEEPNRAFVICPDCGAKIWL